VGLDARKDRAGRKHLLLIKKKKEREWRESPAAKEEGVD
jgi:hypothetical protein